VSFKTAETYLDTASPGPSVFAGKASWQPSHLGASGRASLYRGIKDSPELAATAARRSSYAG
jgi:hypothetical protein